MQGYGRDESVPYAWRSGSWVFVECSQRVRYLYVTYSPCKSIVFAVQKYGFWRAKV